MSVLGMSVETPFYDPIPSFLRNLSAVLVACFVTGLPIRLHDAEAVRVARTIEKPTAPTVINKSGFTDLSAIANVTIEKRYASTNNFCGQVLDTSAVCTIRDIAYQKFEKASELLLTEHPGWKFVIFDAYRPPYVQEKLWQAVRGTPRPKYVAYPKCVSLHSLGLALDLTLADEHGKQLDMGTEFDAFTPLASPRFEAENLRTKKLTQEQYANRLLLRRLMQRAGFIQLQSEWWHYEALHQKTAHERYRVNWHK
jgi:zinc D-Ala-D-Ala dipeptidase